MLRKYKWEISYLKISLNLFKHNFRIDFPNFFDKQLFVFGSDIEIVFVFRKDYESFCRSTVFVKTAPHGFSLADFSDFINICLVPGEKFVNNEVIVFNNNPEFPGRNYGQKNN